MSNITHIGEIAVTFQVTDIVTEHTLYFCEDSSLWTRARGEEKTTLGKWSWFWRESDGMIMFIWQEEDRLGRTLDRYLVATDEVQDAYEQAVLRSIVG